MRKYFALSILSFFFATAFGQILTPVKWDFKQKQVGDNEFELIFIAHIDDGWTVYSQFLESDDGPAATTFNFDKGGHFSLSGKTEESPENRKTVHDDVFGMTLTKFYKKATFTQRIKVSDFSKPVTGYLEFMTCDDTKCLPPTEVDFSFSLSSSSNDVAADKGAVETTKPIVDLFPAENATGAPESQLEAPAKWSATVQKISNGEYDLAFKVKIEDDWHVYSQFMEEGGPVPTAFNFDPDGNVEAIGKAKEIGANRNEAHDPFFNMEVIKFKDEVTFNQKIKIKDPTKPITGYLTFMAGSYDKCLPPTDLPFNIDIASQKVAIGDEAEGDSGPITAFTENIEIDKSTAAVCGLAEESNSREGKGMWGIFILGILGGFVALLTPCVFPMVPLTVSFFTKSASDKKKGTTNAIMYGFYILLVYLLLSLPFHLLDSLNPDILNEISTNSWLNIGFFVIFLVFALSFFGYFELTLPSSWTNKAAAAEGIGGSVGIFFMALTLALVSFSCTGPILGSLLAGALSSDGGAWQLTVGMAGFGLALALPFGLFAAFPRWLNSLPKSGGWMTTVKVVLGFLELALALKFLSNADLVKHWGLLKIEPFLILWIIVFLGLGLYLLGKIRFPHDSPLKKLAPTRLILALASFAFAIYLATGFIYDNNTSTFRSLKLLSGLAPPVGYSWIHPKECPQNLDCFKDFEQGMAYAKKVNKPVMIDFTGHACVNCRKMEEHVWPDPTVYKLLKDEYVLVSLYVDEKIDLPEEEQKTVQMKSGGTRKLRTVGQKWQHMQTENFDNNSQPYYVLISPDGKMLNHPVGYTPDSDEYTHFLRCGLDRFNELGKGNPVLGSAD